MKTCTACGESKPLDAFSRHNGTKDGLQPWCKPCKAASLREWRRANPAQAKQHSRNGYWRHREKRRAAAKASYEANDGARKYLAYRIRRDFGMTLEEYEALIARPCGLCGSEQNIVLDHCHATGEVRGPLCQVCNKAIGMLGDDPDRLRAAAEYIERHRTIK
jgi:hypothetical protein